MDFTIKTYQNLLTSLQKQGFLFHTFAEYIEKKENEKGEKESLSHEMRSKFHRDEIRNFYPVKSRSDYFTGKKFVILRHDVDALPKNSLRFARIQAEMGIKGTYYFRAVHQSWDEAIIKEIHSLGHEVGYHYENMDTVSSKFKVHSSKFKVNEKLLDLAYGDFCANLVKLRKLVPVNTICMHGSPRSKYDNKAIWEKYHYKNLGILGEPYFDVDFDNTFYLTDTGRRWDGWKVSIRDKVPQQEQWNKQGLVFHSTQDIIRAVKSGEFPEKVMFTFHPQRWHSSFYLWLREFILQNAKNQVKRVLVK